MISILDPHNRPNTKCADIKLSQVFVLYWNKDITGTSWTHPCTPQAHHWQQPILSAHLTRTELHHTHPAPPSHLNHPAPLKPSGSLQYYIAQLQKGCGDPDSLIWVQARTLHVMPVGLWHALLVVHMHTSNSAYSQYKHRFPFVIYILLTRKFHKNISNDTIIPSHTSITIMVNKVCFVFPLHHDIDLHECGLIVGLLHDSLDIMYHGCNWLAGVKLSEDVTRVCLGVSCTCHYTKAPSRGTQWVSTQCK